MDEWVEKPISQKREQLLAELRRLEWAKELSEDTLTAIIAATEYVEFHAGEVVIEVGSEIRKVSFLISGRLQASVYDLLGKELLRDSLVRGAAVGFFSLGLSDRSHLYVQATEPSRAIRLTLSELLQLTAKHTDFQLAMFRLSANIFKRYVTVDRALPKPSVVGFVHHTEATRPIVARLARRLRNLDESPCIAGDDEQWRPEGDIPFKLLIADDRVEQRTSMFNWASDRRLFIDLRADHSLEAMIRFIGHLDVLFWCVRPQDTRAAIPLLQELQKSVPKWRDKIRIVWFLDNKTPCAPYVPEFHELCERDFKLTFEPPGEHQGSLLQHGLERIVHHLRGIQIGLALGGGAARGMAHLGVLKALEQHGIYIDMLAGTSAGALTGSVYAAGLDPEFIIHAFKTDLRPSWLFRQLPGGGYWYLLYKYRRHKFDPMLRKYLGQARMEQLIIPTIAVSVDLVEGEPMVREAGQATTNVLESINLPPLSLPILGSGQAFVDGGLLNNIPADVLVAKGCNFVIASSVTAKLEKDFAGIRSKGRQRISRFLPTIEVIMRQNMIQHRSMNAIGVQPADFVIAPDVTSFDISEFTRADEMAAIGETTTNATIGNLHKMLSRLDSKLFGPSSQAPLLKAS